jgi:hypothetical protein
MENTKFAKAFSERLKSLGHKLQDYREPLIGAGVGGAVGMGIGGIDNAINTKNRMKMPHYEKIKDPKERKKRVERDNLIINGLSGAFGGGVFGAQIRAGRKEWQSYRSYAGGGGYRRHFYSQNPGTGEVTRRAKDMFGVNNAKTKAEVHKAFKDLAKKNHPDRGGDAEKMKEINNLYDNLKASSWFDKLAFLKGFEKKASIFA